MRDRRRLLGVALLAWAALLVACGGGGEADGETDVDAAALLVEAAARMEAVDSFRFVVEHEGGSTQIVQGLGMVRAEGAVQGTERMSLDVQARFATTNVRVGIVVLPGEGYLSNPITGRWERAEISIADLFDPASGVTGIMRSVEDPVVTGRERVGGVETYVVEATVASEELTAFVGNAQAGRTVAARAWVGVDDPLVYRLEVTGAVAPNDTETVVRRVILSAFDEPVEIVAPR